MPNTTIATTLPGSRPWDPTARREAWFMAKVLEVADTAIGDSTWPVVHLATVDGDRLILIGVVSEAQT